MTSVLEKPRVTTVTLKLDAAYRERLKTLAATKKRTAHYLMKEAIGRYLDLEEAQQAILASVDGSVTHFEATGLHITHDEVKVWAKKLKTQRNASLPTCHA
jgi:predicted transcriptional regulator